MHKYSADGFATYFTEKFWERIPAIYKHEDGLGENPGVLRGLVEIIGQQAAVLRRSQDRLWEDQFIELCDEWAIPYLADLVGTRLIDSMDARGKRVDVAKTIYYRRRKGTVRVLEELIGDITGWDGKVVEYFQRLGRARHGLDPDPAMGETQLTQTLPGGWADLRHPHGADRAGSPFDEYFYTPDMRKPDGSTTGRHGIPKLGFHLYRLRAFPLQNVIPYDAGDGKYLFDPSGRDIPLFMPGQRFTDWDEWTSAREWEVQAPMECRVLGDTVYLINESVIQSLIGEIGLSEASADDLRIIAGQRITGETRMQVLLSSFDSASELTDPNVFAVILRKSLAVTCGKSALLDEAVWVDAEGTETHLEQVAAANLESWNIGAPDKIILIDPERGRILFPDGVPADPLTAKYHYGFPGEVGAGSYERRLFLKDTPDIIRTHDERGELQNSGLYTFTTLTDPQRQLLLDADDLHNEGVTEIRDSATYTPVSDKLNVRDLTLQAANQERPYLFLEKDVYENLGFNWVLNTSANEDSLLTLDGLWIGCNEDEQLILRGDYEQVIIRHCTLDPGGEKYDGSPIPTLNLLVEAQIETVIIESSITGPIHVEGDGLIELLILRDSIVQSADPAVNAIQLPNGAAEVSRCTIQGNVEVKELRSTESIFTSALDIHNTQSGCFRFSAASTGSLVPRPYESHFYQEFTSFFTSTRFGDPGYFQLTGHAPPEVQTGAENNSEMGAYSRLLN
ncbi:MAG: hypothetical protein GF372_14570, partial [Candidatus Marinimicrobia bacterium]|nr:hypothetical protein [Candidatus Neomarinimicrobiota bacterium]